MPVIHQSGGAGSKGVFYETPDSPDYRGLPAENDLLPASITDLFGLDISRGQLVSPGSPGAKAPGSTWSHSQHSPPLPSPQLNDDPPSFPLDMSSIKSGRGHDMFSSGAYGGGGGGIGAGGSSGAHGTARAIRGSPPYRLNSVGSNCSSPTLEQALLMNCGLGSRSNSPADSDTSGVSSLDSSNLSELVNRLSLGHAQPNYLAQQQNCLSPSIQQDLNTLTNLQALQSLNNRARLLSLLQSYQQQNSGNQQSGSSPVSPISVDRKPWTGNGGGPYGDACGNNLLPVCVSPCSSPFDNDLAVDQFALSNRCLRNAAASLCDTTCSWSGSLPPRIYDNPSYSVKVFLGGVPWDINEAALATAFKQFGLVKVDWPGKDQGVPQPKGYAYIIFDHEKQVKALLQACTKNYSNGVKNWYYKISSKRMKAKDVQVIPWMTSDTNYVKYPSQRLEPERTVFVGALHGMLNAHGLATVMDELFKGVVYAGIDIDKHKYPTGAGRVTFDNHRSFIRAVLTAFIEVKTSKFTKKIQVDPYLEDSPCSVCNVQQGPYFCREINCFRYFCRGCWHLQHSLDASMHSHKAMSRDFKSAKLGALMAPRTVPRLKYYS